MIVKFVAVKICYPSYKLSWDVNKIESVGRVFKVPTFSHILFLYSLSLLQMTTFF